MRLLGVLFLALTFAAHADAEVVMARIAAHPALWTVRSPTATIYLFGSIHLLPENITWHDPKLDAALDAADTFVFETPLDEQGAAGVADFVRANGKLPAGTTLRALLPEKTRAAYAAALEEVHLTPDALDTDRPWLAAIVIDVSWLQTLHYVMADGVDRQLYAFALAHHRAVRTFETPAQQLQLFLPKNQPQEVAEFAASLKNFRTDQNTIGAMVDAWGAGDVAKVGRLMNAQLAEVPGEKKLLIDDRNRAWIRTLDEMLAQKTVAFVTVGTGHLAGPQGVPALLRRQGYRVEGP